MRLAAPFAILLLSLFAGGDPSTRDWLTARLTYRCCRDTYVQHCRLATPGCKARIDAIAGYIDQAAKDHGIDRLLLAAMVMRESGGNPFAVGKGGERGILQIHPKRKWSPRFVRDAAYRDACESEPGACQEEIVQQGAAILRRGIDTCGTVRAGLSMYNAGNCTSEYGLRYADRVLRERHQS